MNLNSEHIVQDRSVTYLPELPVKMSELEQYTITLEFESSPDEWNEAGIVFGGDEGNFHFFIINSFEKYYTYGSHEARDLNANWKDYLLRKLSDAIDSSANELKIKKRGQHLTFYINGKRITKTDYPELGGYRIGFYLRGGNVFNIESVKVEAK